MSHAEPSWDLYRTFLAVLREGSLSGAARSLGLTQPTIGRHIEALEQAVDFQLFTRSQRGLAATEAALELRPYAEALSSTAASLLRAASGQSSAVKGTVRVSASEVVSVEVLPPILAALRERYPELVIELAVSNTVEDLLRRDADIAVRMVEPGQEALVVKRLGTISLGLHAHRRYLDRRGTPKRYEDLAAHDVIGFDRETPALRSLLKNVPRFDVSRFALRTNSDLAQLAAIRAGFGIGVCQVALARRDRDLVRVLPDAFELKLGTWLAMHENLRSTPRCRIVFDALAAGLKGHVER
jgi:DNA-binding transcriptional LysR family regulator